MRVFLYRIIAVVVVVIVVVGIWAYFKKPTAESVVSFEECMAAGYEIIEGYPNQCKTPEGKIFVEDIGNALEKADLIRVTNPRPGEPISSPLVVEGEARGYWFFEASFPIFLFNESGSVIASAVVQAESDWMTKDFVSFRATLEFREPTSKQGTLLLQKDNPSGLPEHDDELVIPVMFNGNE